MKTMTKGRVEAIMCITLLVMWTGGVAVHRYLLDEKEFEAYNLIPILFLVFLFVFTGILARAQKRLAKQKTDGRRIFRELMWFKAGKLAACTIFIICYANFIGELTNSFILTFAIFYVVFLFLETMAVYQLEKRCKLIKQENDPLTEI